jgi:Zn-dependent protease with chaperone function
MERRWEASYLDGHTAIRQPATIRLMSEGLEVTTSGGWTRVWPYSEIRQTQGFYEGEEVRLERGGQLPETLLIGDQRFLASLSELVPQQGSRFHDPRRRASRLRLTVLAALGVVVGTGILYLWGIPALAALAAPRVPVAWEESLGRSVVEHLAPEGSVCRDPEGQRLLDVIVGRLAATVPGSPYRFRVLVIDRPQVNALAAPGGNILVFRGLVAEAASPEELAGVLAHEMQHVLDRHATQALIQHTSIGLLLAALTGDMSGPLVYGLASARVLGQLQYSRRAESEADAGAVAMLRAARVDPSGLLHFLESLTSGKQPRSVLEYLSTHPSPTRRIAEMKTLIARPAGAPPVPLLSDEEWATLKQICAGSR